MRIITTLLFFLFIALSPILHAQNKLQFKGIPIEGSVKTFISKLQAQGAKLENTEDDLYFFRTASLAYLIARLLYHITKIQLSD